MTRFYVKVRTDQDAFSIDMSGTYPGVSVESPAEQQQANHELTQRLADILDTPVHIVSGHRSTRKQLAADIEQDEIDRRLQSYATD